MLTEGSCGIGVEFRDGGGIVLLIRAPHRREKAWARKPHFEVAKCSCTTHFAARQRSYDSYPGSACIQSTWECKLSAPPRQVSANISCIDPGEAPARSGPRDLTDCHVMIAEPSSRRTREPVSRSIRQEEAIRCVYDRLDASSPPRYQCPRCLSRSRYMC